MACRGQPAGFAVAHTVASDAACLKLLISKGLSILIIFGSFGLKLPQILTLMAAKSAKGVSLTMFLTETAIFAISGTNGARKGFPLTAYVENWVILSQVVVICVLLCVYSNRTAAALLYVAGTAALLMALFAVPATYVELLLSTSILLAIYGRVPQILSNYNNRNTGALSLASFALSFGGGLARVFTTIQEAPSVMALTGYVVGVVLNGIILAQIIMYRHNASKDTAKVATKRWGN